MNLRKELDDEAEKLGIEKIKTDHKIGAVDTEIGIIKSWAWGLVIAGVVIMALAFFPFYLMDIQYQKLNLYGDFIGGSVASLWALAGLLFIYMAFLAQKQQGHMQRLELKYNQYEMKSTRFELHEQKEQMKHQNETLSLQSFENTFFHLLQSQNEILKLIDYRAKDNSIISTGRDCFRSFYNTFQTELGETTNLEDVIDAYIGTYEDHDGDLGHYFRNLYHILRFVNESGVKDKHKYTRLVRAQLSTYELAFLFYNCLSDNGIEKFKPLVEMFSMLKNMSWKFIISEPHLLEYSADAYGRRVEEIRHNFRLEFILKANASSFEILILEEEKTIKINQQENYQALLVLEGNFNLEFKNSILKILYVFFENNPDQISRVDKDNLIEQIAERIYRVALIFDRNVFYIPLDNPIVDSMTVRSLLNNIYRNSDKA